MMDDRHPVIETPRLRLREITLDDAPWYLTHYNDILDSSKVIAS